MYHTVPVHRQVHDLHILTQGKTTLLSTEDNFDTQKIIENYTTPSATGNRKAHSELLQRVVSCLTSSILFILASYTNKGTQMTMA